METEITFADSPATVEAAVALLRAHDRVALDTEADNLHHYATRVCLIQLSAGGRTFLIDTLAGVNLDAVFAELARKWLIMHGSDYDLRLLWELRQFKPAQVFDTMLAAQLVGRQQIGLASLLHDLLGIHHPKDSQKSDWSRRPLPEKMSTYAAGDVVHLFELQRVLTARLDELGRTDWHRQKCVWQIEVATSGFPRTDEHAWRIGPTRHWPPRGLAALYELWHWRDQEARRLDRPPFKVMSNDYLLKLALAVVDGQDQEAFERLPKGLRRGPSRGLSEALQRAAARDPKSLPKRPDNRDRRQPLSAEELSRQDAIRDHRDRVARELEIDPTLIASRYQIAQLSRQPADADRVLLPWQAELLRSVLQAFTSP